MFTYFQVPIAHLGGTEWDGQVTWMEVRQGGEDEKGGKRWGKEGREGNRKEKEQGRQEANRAKD